MATTFIVEDGGSYSDANAYCTVAEADQITENFGNSTDWSGATDAEKEAAIRQATRYLDLNYVWAGWKADIDQALQWPRYDMYDEDSNYISESTIPEKLKQACAYLAVKVIEGDTLLEDLQNESKVKKTKDVIGPLTEEREYVSGENPEKTYAVAEKLIVWWVVNGSSFSSTDLERA